MKRERAKKWACEQKLWSGYEVKLIKLSADSSLFRSQSLRTDCVTKIVTMECWNWAWKSFDSQTQAHTYTRTCAHSFYFCMSEWVRFTLKHSVLIKVLQRENEVTKWSNWVVSVQKHGELSLFQLNVLPVSEPAPTHTHSKHRVNQVSTIFVHIILPICRTNVLLQMLTANSASRCHSPWGNSVQNKIKFYEIGNWKAMFTIDVILCVHITARARKMIYRDDQIPNTEKDWPPRCVECGK